MVAVSLVLIACGRVANDPADAAVSDAGIDIGACTLSNTQKMFEASNAEFLGLVSCSSTTER